MRLKNLEDVLAQRAEIEAGWKELGRAREAEAGWNSRLLSHSQLQDRLNGVQRAVDQRTRGPPGGAAPAAGAGG